MINEIIKTIKESRKRRKEIFEQNKKKYWKLPASERLHYDSVRNKINKDYSAHPLYLTLFFIKIFFYFFVFLIVIKLLFELDKEIFIRVLSILLPMFPLIFKVSISVDFFMFFIFELITKPNKIKKLNKIYGFKKIS